MNLGTEFMRPTTLAALVVDLSTGTPGKFDSLIDQAYQALISHVGSAEAHAMIEKERSEVC